MEHRLLERKTIVSAHVGVVLEGGQYIETEIYDCTPKGAFIALAKEHCPRPGGTIRLQGTLRAIPYNLVATVRWVGHSGHHHLDGIGILFSAEPVAFRRLYAPPSIIPSIPTGAPY